MTTKTHISGADVRGYGRLAVDAVLGLTSLVETMHHNILRTPGVFGAATQQPARGITGLVYRTIRGVTRLVGGSVDALLGRLAPLIGEGPSSPERTALLAALNGVLGDHLAACGNLLAISMQMRHDAQALTLTRAALANALPGATGKLLLLVHGLCMSDLQWRRNGRDHGAALVESGFTPIYLNYNTGLHISTNGRELAGLLEKLVRAWPVALTQIAIVGHSMGGLVARSACDCGARAGHRWMRTLRKMIFLGVPHAGAPLERGGNWVDAALDASPYTTAFARLGKMRSAGITDLRHGSVCDDDWQHGDRFARSRKKAKKLPLPEGVQCYAIAASLAAKSGGLKETLFGDGLVPLESALAAELGIPKRRQWIGYGMHHLDLLDRREVSARIQRWLNAP